MKLSLDFNAFAGADYTKSVSVVPATPIIVLGVPGILNGGAYAQLDASLNAGFAFQASATLSYTYNLPPVDVQFGFDTRNNGVAESSAPFAPNMAAGQIGGNTQFNAKLQVEGNLRVRLQNKTVTLTLRRLK